MLKNSIIQLLDNNVYGIKNSFNINDGDIKSIREFLNKDYENFKTLMDGISTSNLNDRGKMTICCLIGYVNGIYRKKDN